MSEQYELPLFPLNVVLFPGMVLPLQIFEDRYKQLLVRCVTRSEPFGVILLKSGRAEENNSDIYPIGTTAHITDVKPIEGERFHIMIVGDNRFRVVRTHTEHEYLTGIVEDFPLDTTPTQYTNPIAKKLGKKLQIYFDNHEKLSELDLDLKNVLDNPEALAYLTAMVLPISNIGKQLLLSADTVQNLLIEEYDMLRHEINILEILKNEPPIQDGLSMTTFSLN